MHHCTAEVDVLAVAFLALLQLLQWWFAGIAGHPVLLNLLQTIKKNSYVKLHADVVRGLRYCMPGSMPVSGIHYYIVVLEAVS